MARILKIDPSNPDFDAVCTVAHEIIHGRVIVYPTDTIYGIGADACNSDAVERVFRAKKRDPARPILILVNSLQMVAGLVDSIPDPAKALIDEFWPGPLTLVFRASASLPQGLTGGSGTIGIRCPQHPFCLEVLKVCNRPITSTSANISGEDQSISIKGIAETFESAVDLIVDAGDVQSALPSTIVDVTGSTPKLLRAGSLSESRLRPYLS
ncbi:MAG: L-threonylcarbamoyladenylate synthase [Bacteroidota bacterium]